MAFVTPQSTLQYVLDPANLKNRFARQWHEEDNGRAGYVRTGPDAILQDVAALRQEHWENRRIGNGSQAIGFSGERELMHLARVPTPLWTAVKKVEPGIMKNTAKLCRLLGRSEWHIGSFHSVG
jgi:hypothetical protein